MRQMRFGCSHWLWQVQQLLNRVYVLVASVVSDSLQPHDLQPERLLCPRDSAGKNWRGLPFPSPGDLADPGITPTSLVSCTGRQVLYHWATSVEITTDNFKQGRTCWLWCCWYCLLWTTHTHTHTHTHSHTHTHTQAPNTPQSSWQFPALPVFWSPLFFTDKGFPVGDFSWGRVKTDIYSQGLLVSKKTYPMKQSFNLYFTYLYIKLLRNPLNPTEC